MQIESNEKGGRGNVGKCSGGPWRAFNLRLVINASLYGVVEEKLKACQHRCTGNWRSEGILKENFLDLMQYPEKAESSASDVITARFSRYVFKQEDYNAMAESSEVWNTVPQRERNYGYLRPHF